MALAGAVPEVVEADLVQRRQRLVAGDVAAELGRGLVGAHHHRHGVPADDRPKPALERRIARQLRLTLERDRVDVRRVEGRDRPGAGALSALHDARKDVTRTTRPVVLEDRVDRLQPLARLERIEVSRHSVNHSHRSSSELPSMPLARSAPPTILAYSHFHWENLPWSSTTTRRARHRVSGSARGKANGLRRRRGDMWRVLSTHHATTSNANRRLKCR